MANLSDEDKAKQVLGDVESKADETTEENETLNEEESDNPAAEDKSEENSAEEEQSTETEEEPESPAATTFTKQFPNFKSENLEDYIKEVEQAYTNSSNEAIRLKRENDELKAVASQQPAQSSPQSPPANPPANPTTPTAETSFDLQFAHDTRVQAMNSAFDEFAKEYPNVREDINRFTAASDGVYSAYAASHNGVAPTFDQLYKGIADILGWQPIKTTAKKDAAIKNSGVSSSTPSATTPPPKQPNVSDKEVEVYRRMFPAKSVEDARKELASVKV